MSQKSLTAILLFSCRDRVGLVSRLSHFIFERGGNILDLDQHVDANEGIFSARIAWDMQNFTIDRSQLKAAFAPLANEFNATWNIHFSEDKTRLAIFVSKSDHCLQEILWRYRLGEFRVEIPLIISNHPNLKPLADHYGIPYYVISITHDNKQEQEKKQLELLGQYQIDTVILARYMQILTPQIVDTYPNQIINIHHSFLPAFIGRSPYTQAYVRGVKIIGATSHYVTAELDQGPIIEQDIIRISHRDSLQDLVRKGRDLERLVLARAIDYHTNNRVLVNGKKTIIFE
ncbi:MAG: formyltetrahydrofolate deformylase [Halothece sp. Uz-M2-17]|nr:formyltetrahydrofolate deformylase [Halothece sp. Uz-M2-17]